MADTGRVDELKRKFEENPKRYFAPLANEYRKAGQPDAAIELCRTYLPQQPTHMSGYIVYAQALLDAGQHDESAAVFKQALTLDPENLIALRNLGDMARDAGDSAGAMRWYGKVLELDPRNEEIVSYITSIASPGSQPVTRAPERPAPPTVRPEPEPDESAVRLEDIVSEPDMAQTPIVADEPPADLYGASLSEEPGEPLDVSEWTASMEPSGVEAAPSADAAHGVEGPWHASAEPTAAAEESAATSSAENPAATEPIAAPLRFSDYLPEEDAAFAPTAQELGIPHAAAAPSAAPPPLASPVLEDSPFVTETMAELYMQQGLRGEALTIYRQLALKRDDPALHQRIAELEADEPAARSAASSEPGKSGESVRAFFARIGSARPAERVELAANRVSPLAALFGSSQPDAADLRAAERLSGAFGAQRSGNSQS